jgi:hypothetical protein
MPERIVQFLSFEGCPRAPAALSALEAAIRSLPAELKFRLRRVDLMDPATPEDLKRWGSPTILLGGLDIAGGRPADAGNCRIYSGPGGVPDAREIAEALLRDGGE